MMRLHMFQTLLFRLAGLETAAAGTYHGKAGFDAFTHYKSVLFKANWFESFIKYPPYSNFKNNLISLFPE